MAKLTKKDCEIIINVYKAVYPPRGKTRDEMIDLLCWELKNLLRHSSTQKEFLDKHTRDMLLALGEKIDAVSKNIKTPRKE